MTCVERFNAARGPSPSSAMPGITKNVATVQARFAMPPTSALTIWPAPSRRSAWRAEISAPTTSWTPAHARITSSRERAAASPSATVVSCPSSARDAHALSATLQKIPIATRT